ncbi:putative bifunctional diguanylate cyclase/phosphodiesterase [Nitrincola sp. MINF-07-Sa-05]|uniref:putative bifunctional diguanylate cyclase/phosphodiesterase n=1 Tax=Nitrincola salilacus TaxID=3400273 RepID=UPI0039185CCD
MNKVSTLAEDTLLTLSRDVTDQRLHEALIGGENEFRTLVENSPDLIARFNHELRILYINPAFTNAIGYDAALLGMQLQDLSLNDHFPGIQNSLLTLFLTDCSHQFEASCYHSQMGKMKRYLMQLTPEPDEHGQVKSALLVGRDISELHTERQRVERMKLYDPLTQLPSRALLMDRGQQMIADAAWHDQLAGVLMLDIENFKTINDSLGHTVGNEVLNQIAARLNATLPPYATIARLGGDNFGVLLPQLQSLSEVESTVDMLLSEFNMPFLYDGDALFCSCSLGIALYPEDATDVDDLIKHAESAMFSSKSAGRNGYRFYSRELTDTAQHHLSLEQELHHAMGHNQLELHFQPKVKLGDGSLIGAEALLRWHHPAMGLVPPGDFISIAEETGLIVPIGKWVLQVAAENAARWNRGRHSPMRVAVNISAVQFKQDDLLKSVCDILSHTGCRPEWLELEITESLLLKDNSGVQETLQGLSLLGITIAIDDFGTGHSALGYLAQFDIHCLKIDRQFVHEIQHGAQQRGLLKAIVVIANVLNLELVAEGVECAEQADFLVGNGCEFAQGFLFDPALPAAAFEEKYLNNPTLL